ncbi:MAG TPA: cohesin domain-containing protein, partial [Thermoanaerobaculia bacterium]|nr:cohesin domain-containing protein [Thermoanaerobaculia bacterium]
KRLCFSPLSPGRRGGGWERGGWGSEGLAAADSAPWKKRVSVGTGFALLAALAALLALACGGGGGGGPTAPTPTPTPAAGIVFTPQGAPGGNAIFLSAGAATTATTLVLEVRANQVTDLYGVAFNLTYPSAQLQFSRATAGSLLGGDTGSVQAVVSTPGTLVVGGSHLGAVPGANGSGVVLTLEFTATAAGQGSFAFALNSAFNSTGQTQAGISWLAGSVQVTR